MFHLVDNFQDKAGNALAGYFVKLKVPDGAYATLYADTSSTPIISVSGVADAAVTDANGFYDLYVADGDYDIEFFDKNDISQRILTISSVPMYSLGIGPEDVAAAIAAAATAEDAADTATSASIIATATTNGGPYDTTAEGVAAVAEGDEFGVVNAGAIDFYRKTGGVAVSLGVTLATSASVVALGDAVSTTASGDPLALTDLNGIPGLTIDDEGRWIDIDGNAPLDVLASAAVAGAPAGIADAVTPAAKLIADKLHHAPLRPKRFDLMLWQGNDSARGSNAVRMPAAADFSGQSTTIFAHERSGPSGAEEGLGLAYRDITIDFANETVTLGAIGTLSRGSAWGSGIGQNTNPTPFRIQQGANAGIIEVLHAELNPDNVAYTTAGTRFDWYRRTSADSYASKTKVWDGLADYTTLGLTAPTEMQGFNPASGDNCIEIPAGYPNAGRRIIAGPMPYVGGQALVTYYSEKDSTTWQVGEWFDFQSLGLGIGNSGWNECSLIWTPEGIHLYARSDAIDGVNAATYYNLTHRGRFYAFSATGIGGWANKAWLQEPNIGNTPAQALYIPDGSGRVFLGGSTQHTAGDRRQYKLFMGYSPTEFFAACEPHYAADLAGYGPSKWVLGNDGQMWLVLIQERGDGYLGFNGTTNIYATCVNMAWVIANMETI